MSNPVVFNVLTGEFQSYEEFYGKEKEHKKTRYKLFAGLGGGFGGADFIKVEEFDTADEADKAAYDLAWEDYESYGGCHGLLDEDEVRRQIICEEYGIDEDDIDDDFDYDIDEDDVQERYKDEIEGWIEWRAEECNDDCCNCDEESECKQKDEITP